MFLKMAKTCEIMEKVKGIKNENTRKYLDLLTSLCIHFGVDVDVVFTMVDEYINKDISVDNIFVALLNFYKEKIDEIDKVPFELHEAYFYESFCQNCPDFELETHTTISKGVMGENIVGMRHKCPNIEKCRQEKATS